MSGTSLDGLDACLVRETLDGSRIEVIQTLETSFSTEVERGFKRIIETGQANPADTPQSAPLHVLDGLIFSANFGPPIMRPPK